MSSLFFELKLVLRHLAKSPGFTATAVLMLAFGIGATTAVFSIVEGVLLRPLPFADPERLVVLGDHVDGTDWGQQPGSYPMVTAPEIRTYARETHAFASMGAYGSVGSYELAGQGQSSDVNVLRMSASLFPTLGVAPLLGRVYTAQEEEQRERMVVLSYETYKNRFQSNPNIIGTKILLDRRPYPVVGVMPPGFQFPLQPGRLNRADLWIPLIPSELELNEGAINWGFTMVGRLKPGISAQQAEGDLAPVTQSVMHSFRGYMSSMHMQGVVRPLRDLAIGASRRQVELLFLAIAVVLLIVCANLAGLLLVRAIERQREIAVRLALGAPAFTLMRQAMLESLLISLAGALLGLGLAAIALMAGKHLLPEDLPRIAEIGLNWKIVLFPLLLACVTGALCGAAPAFATLRTDVNTAMKEGGRSGSAGGNHGGLRSVLVVAEIAIALMLLAVSGLLLRSFQKMNAVDLGFQPDHVATARYWLPYQSYGEQPQIDAFNNELLRRLRQLPGAKAVGLATFLPAITKDASTSFDVEGYVPPHGSGEMLTTTSTVKGDYFQAMGIPLLRGRLFDDRDRIDSQPVAIVGHTFARHFWPGQNPIGKRVRLGTSEMPTTWLNVVGEVADVKMSSPDQDAGDQMYEVLDQVIPDLGALMANRPLYGNSLFIVLRSRQSPEQMENAMQSVARSIDPILPLVQVQTMSEAVSETESSRRFNTVVLSSFACASVLLAVLGIYSVISFSVASRIREMAIRMALGSQRSHIVRLIVASGARMAGIGCLLGAGGALTVAWFLRSFLFGVSPFDPLALLLACACIFLLALAASAIPARRAASVDPNKALHAD